MFFHEDTYCVDSSLYAPREHRLTNYLSIWREEMNRKRILIFFTLLCLTALAACSSGTATSTGIPVTGNDNSSVTAVPESEPDNDNSSVTSVPESEPEDNDNSSAT